MEGVFTPTLEEVRLLTAYTSVSRTQTTTSMSHTPSPRHLGSEPPVASPSLKGRDLGWAVNAVTVLIYEMNKTNMMVFAKMLSGYLLRRCLLRYETLSPYAHGSDCSPRI
jgi:hypothetical protein